MTKAGMTFVEGNLWGLKTVVVVSGIGKVNMAVCTQILIDIFSVDTVINTGVAARSIIHWKLVTLCFHAVPSSMTWMFPRWGDPVGIIPRMDESIFAADETLVKLAKEACEKANSDIICHVGKVVSGDQFIADGEKKQYFERYF